MSNDNSKFTELCTAYVLHALSEEEEQEFQRLLAQASDEERALLVEMEAVAAEIATAVPRAAPSATVKQKIMDIAAKTSATESQKPATIHRMSWYRVAAAASFIFIFTSLGLLFYSQSLVDDLQSQSETIAQQATTIQALKTEMGRKEELLTILEARDVDLVVMGGMKERSPNGYGKVVWDKKGGRALLQVANLPSVPSDKDYQLWFIVDGKPISAGVFAIDDAHQDNFFKIEQLQSSATKGAFAVTMEPKGGMPQPTGNMYLHGNM
jgi:anti-sigma-K factor RskA